MIKGLRLRLTTEELKAHCLARAEYHTKRADTKEADLPDLRAAMEKIKAAGAANLNPQQLAHMNKVSNSYHIDSEAPVEALERDIAQHRNQALAFKFYGEHLFAEDYDLDESDLKRLQILK